MSKQKYTVIYKKPWEEESKRTRFSSLKIAKIREEHISNRGWRCKIISKNNYPHDVDPKPPTIVRKNSNVVNHWKFIPQMNGGFICTKNGDPRDVEQWFK